MAKASDLSTVGCKYLGTPYSTMDCQAFVERCLSDIGINKNLPGSNAWFRAMTWQGTPEECKSVFGEIPKGAFLFILESDGKEPEKYAKDGIGNASHIGIRTGMSGKQMVQLGEADGDPVAKKANYGSGAIHSSSTRQMVATSDFRDKTVKGGWNRIGLWNKLDYGEKINELLESQQPKDSSDNADTEPVNATVFASSGTTVKLRQRPSTGCGVYWDVPIGETVEVLHKGNWCRVRWNGRIGYMKSEFVRIGEDMSTIEPDPEETPLLAIVWAAEGNTVKMRYKPSTDCQLYEKVPIGTQLAVNQKGEAWCKVSLGNRDGWYMKTQFLKFEEE